VESLDAFTQELDGLDDLAGGRTGGVEVHDLVLAFEKDLGSIERVAVGTGLSLELDLVFFGLVLLLAKKSVSADGKRRSHVVGFITQLSVS
jgi:hypothetical protein